MDAVLNRPSRCVRRSFPFKPEMTTTTNRAAVWPGSVHRQVVLHRGYRVQPLRPRGQLQARGGPQRAHGGDERQDVR